MPKPRPRSLAATLIAGVALASCGDEEAASGPGRFVPPEAPIYLEASIEPGEQVENAEAFLERLGELPLLGSRLDAQGLIGLIEDSAADEGVDFSFAEDVEPWLGDRFGAGILSLDEATDDAEVVVAVEVTDEQIARDSIDRLAQADGEELEEVELQGVSANRFADGEGAYAVLEGFLLLGTSDAAFEAGVEAQDGDSIAATDEFEDALDSLPEERLASAYVDFGFFLEMAAAEDDAGPEEIAAVRAILGDFFDSSIAAALTAGEDSLAIDSSLPSFPLAGLFSGSDLLIEAPADSVAAVGLTDLGGQAEALMDTVVQAAADAGEEGVSEEQIAAGVEAELGVPLDDLTAALGDAALSVQGDLVNDFVVSSEITIADPAVGTALLDRLREDIESQPTNAVGPPIDGTGEGFSVTDRRPSPDISFGSFAIQDDRAQILLASSEAAGREQPEAGTLEDNQAYQRAAGALGDHALVGFADLGPILDAAVGDSSVFDTVTGQVSSDEAIVRFLADNLGYAVLGSTAEDDRLIQRFVLGLAE